jgi:hypothetical protein
MEIYTSDTSNIIRQDFMRFSSAERRLRQQQKAKAAEKRNVASLERLRDEMTRDDGLGSYGSYKCPIF